MEKKIPKLRFSEFNGAWKKYKIGDLFNISVGGDIDNIEFSSSKTEEFIYPIFSNSEKNEGLYGYSKVYKFNKNCITITGRGSGIGKAIVRYEKFLPIIRLIVLEPLQEMNLEFLEKVINALNIEKKNKGKFLLTAPQVYNLEIYLPTNLKEQDKINNFFSVISRKEKKLKRKLELFNKYKISVIKKIFDQHIKFKDNNSNNYPKWEKKKLDDISEFYKGKGIFKKNLCQNGIECIRYGELYTLYNEEINNIFSKTNLHKKDLILSEVNDILIPSSGENPYNFTKASCIMKKGVAIGGDINILRTKVNGVFLSYYLNYVKKNDIVKLVQGVSIFHLYPKQLKELEVEIPDILEQKKIADFLLKVDYKISLVEKQLSKIFKFKKGIIQKIIYTE